MNSKQRKIASRIRERAELDCSAQLQRLALERSQFEELKIGTQKTLLELSDSLIKERKELNELVEQNRKRVAADKEAFVISSGLLREANVIREVILELELDVEPAEIALNIRKKFGLLIPEW